MKILLKLFGNWFRKILLYQLETDPKVRHAVIMLTYEYSGSTDKSDSNYVFHGLDKSRRINRMGWKD